MATGGDVEYTGQDMKTTHAAMNISEMEFNAVVDDIMDALDENKIAQQEKNEILAILWSVRPDVVNSNISTKALSPTTAAHAH
jgi:hemoglobin